jgi:predicted nucleotidyltransferase
MLRSLKNENILARVYEVKRGLSRFASDQVRYGSQKRGLSRNSAFGLQRVLSTRVKLLLEGSCFEEKNEVYPGRYYEAKL